MNITLDRLKETVSNIETYHAEALERILKALQDPQHCFYQRYSLCRERLSEENNNHRFMLSGLCHLFGFQSEEGVYISTSLENLQLKWLESEGIRSSIQFLVGDLKDGKVL